jgi:Icc-related predicted phosphoesterase
VKIAAISDLHGFLPVVPPCDLLLIGGDICPVANHSLPAQQEFLDRQFRRWLEDAPAKQIVGIAGNHDFIFDTPSRIPTALRWTYLQDNAAEIDGLKIWGSPWSVLFGSWPFMEREPALARRWASIPVETDILLVHGPPMGYGDKNFTNRRCGSTALLEAIGRVNPRLCVFGHIHEDHGRWALRDMLLANVSHVNEVYDPIHKAEVFEI